MSSWQLGFDLVVAFVLAAFLLFNYGNWYRHHIIVTISVLIAWYFSFIIVFVLPIDISNAAYNQCLSQWANISANGTTPSMIPSPSSMNDSIVVDDGSNSTLPTYCKQPASYVGKHVMENLWRIVYWTSQCLTWLILPMMQSYTQAGDFTVKGKLKSALLDNAIYYGSYLFICGILLAYIAVKPELQLDWPKLKAIASSASNTWGLFLLVFMLGYGLVTLPRSLWLSSCKGHSVNNAYFKMAKMSQERNSAEEALDDVLETIQCCVKSLNGRRTHLATHLDTIQMQIPTEFRERMLRRRVDSFNANQMDEKVLAKLHKQVKRALQNYNRTERQWEQQISQTVFLEDVERNLRNRDHKFKSSFPSTEKSIYAKTLLFNPTIEWYWRCVTFRYVLKVVSVCMGLMSIFVIWSEVTFFNRSPVLSLFAVFVNMAKANYDYVSLELVSTLTIAYLAVCAFYTVFKIRVFNFYYLAGSHQTDEYSLIFAGMLLCRLTPPLCLNFLGLIHMDSHILKRGFQETAYTHVMGHMDVLSLIADGFNIYFPIGILLISMLTWFKVGSRILSTIGFQQFLVDDDITSDLVNEGQQLINREKRRRQRTTENAERRKTFQERISSRTQGVSADPVQQNAADNRSPHHSAVDESSPYGDDDLTSVLKDHQQIIYGSPESTSAIRSSHQKYQPPRDLFDDV